MTHPYNEGEFKFNPHDIRVLDDQPGELTRLENKSDAWHTVKVVLCTAIVFAFLSYLAYLSQGK